MDPTQPTPPLANPPKINPLNYLLALVTLLIGIVLGYVFFNTFPYLNKSAKPQDQVTKQADKELTLPVDAVQIQSCGDHKGILFVKPNDIPVGPIFMVQNGKVIGVEFMLAKEDFLNGKSYKYLSGLDMKVNHVNIGLLSQGHEGYNIPHYHVDLYTVTKEVEDGIVCPKSAVQPPSASSSAQPATGSALLP